MYYICTPPFLVASFYVTIEDFFVVKKYFSLSL